jgi:hypothetical protein
MIMRFRSISLWMVPVAAWSLACGLTACVGPEPGPTGSGGVVTMNPGQGSSSTGTCVPSCSGKSCGDNGCGATCGSCPGGQTCTSSGQCTTPPSGGGSTSGFATGASCSSNGQCADYQQGRGFCANFGNGGVCADSCVANSGCVSGCCAAGSLGNVCGPIAACEGGNGDFCNSNGQCTTGQCSSLDYCFSTCSPTNAVCAGGHGLDGLFNQYNQLNWCVHTTSGTDQCFPGCQTNADCANYGGTARCVAITDVTGTATSICENGG